MMISLEKKYRFCLILGGMTDQSHLGHHIECGHSHLFSPSCPKATNTPSTITTAPSIIIPKSMAPIESRLADIPITRKQINANNKANGIITATITVVRQSAMKINTINVTNNIPSIRLWVTVFTARFTKSSRS